MVDPRAATVRVGDAQRLVVVWRVTTRCNLSCGFCAYDRRLPGARLELDEQVARRLALSLWQNQVSAGRAVHVSLLGGEPLSWRPLPRIAAEFAGLGLSLGVTSNGSAVASAATRQLLLDHFDELTVSVDGVGAVHDELRGWPGGFAQLERSLSALAQSKQRLGRGPELRVNTVLMRDNIAQFAELCRKLADFGVEELTFNRLGERDRPEFFEQHRPTLPALERFARELPALSRELLERGLRVRGTSEYVERLLGLERGEASSPGSCEPGRTFLFVDEHGKVAPCNFTLDEYGQGWPDDARDVSDLPRRFLLRQAAQRAPACNDCRSTQVAGKFGGA